MDISLDADKLVRDEVILFDACLRGAAEIVALRRGGDRITTDDVEQAKARFTCEPTQLGNRPPANPFVESEFIQPVLGNCEGCGEPAYTKLGYCPDCFHGRPTEDSKKD